MKLNGTPQQVRMHPPLLGEHTSDILKEIGMDASDVEDLTAGGAFAP